MLYRSNKLQKPMSAISQLHRWKFVITGKNILLLDVPQYWDIFAFLCTRQYITIDYYEDPTELT